MVIFKKVIEEKICGDCGELKPITEYDISISGKRRESICRNCKLKQFEPKPAPKVVGKSKPVIGFGSNKPIDPEYDLYKPEGKKIKLKYVPDEKVEVNKMKVDEIKEEIEGYVEAEGDGFQIKDLTKVFKESSSSMIYAHLKKLVERGELYKGAKEQTHRYFLYEKNYKYYNEMAKVGQSEKTKQWNAKIVNDIKKGNVPELEIKKVVVAENPKVGDKVLVFNRKVGKPEEKGEEENKPKMYDLINAIITQIIQEVKTELKKEILEKINEEHKVIDEKIKGIDSGIIRMESNLKSKDGNYEMINKKLDEVNLVLTNMESKLREEVKNEVLEDLRKKLME